MNSFIDYLTGTMATVIESCFLGISLVVGSCVHWHLLRICCCLSISQVNCQLTPLLPSSVMRILPPHSPFSPSNICHRLRAFHCHRTQGTATAICWCQRSNTSCYPFPSQTGRYTLCPSSPDSQWLSCSPWPNRYGTSRRRKSGRLSGS